MIQTCKVWLLGLILFSTSSVFASERVTYFHSNGLNSIVAATDESGRVLWSEEYRPYGERLLKQKDSANRLWYTGKEEVEEVGLQYFGARWYNPAIGAFLSRDPVGFRSSNPLSFNRYAYGNNNPYRYIDPDGRESRAASFMNAQTDLLVSGQISEAQYFENGRAAGIGAIGGLIGVGLGWVMGPRELLSMAISETTGVEIPSIRGVVKKFATKGGANAFKNLSKADKKLANDFMTRFDTGPSGAKQLLDDIAKNGVPKIDNTTRNALNAYRETIKAVGGNKIKTANSEVFQTRLKVLDKVLGK